MVKKKTKKHALKEENKKKEFLKIKNQKPKHVHKKRKRKQKQSAGIDVHKKQIKEVKGLVKENKKELLKIKNQKPVHKKRRRKAKQNAGIEIHKKQIKEVKEMAKEKKKEEDKEKQTSLLQPVASKKHFPTLQLKSESEIAMDFSTKAYEKFDKIIKSIVLFGSSVKQDAVAGSDIDIVIVIDDVAIVWDQELIAWYREELDKLMRQNPYEKSLHINTIKLSTWWEDLMRGDPVLLNILRYGEAMIDFAGFFEPLKFLLLNGKIKSTPEAVYNCLQRAPAHFLRSRVAELNAIEGLYWAMVDSSHAALIAAGIPPASPEHIPVDLKEVFVNPGLLKMKYVVWYRDLLMLHKKIAHGEITELKGVEIDDWQDRTKEFMRIMADLVNQNIN